MHRLTEEAQIMSFIHRALATIAVAVALIAAAQPVAAAQPAPSRASFPGVSPIPIPGPTLPPLPPAPEGELMCHNGLVIGNFTDLDQDDATLRVVGISADDVPVIEYPAVRAWGTWIVYMPTHFNHVNLVAYDDDGNRRHHRSRYMLADGSCIDF